MTGKPIRWENGPLRMQDELSDRAELINGQISPALPSALAKRIKRHMVGREQVFFAVTAPGFEPLCRDELLMLGIPAERIRMLEGGVEFTGRMIECCKANLYSRVATRILMRITDFKATGFGELERKISGIPWDLYLYPGSSVEIGVSIHKSRLHHSEAVAERIGKGISGCLPVSETAVPSALPQRIFVRAVSDRFTISMDSSGLPLYKRGIKTHGGKAPLRETGAAAILRVVGYRPGDVLVDPMCGSGTFSIEAAMMSENIPAGWFRDFAFMAWPSFRSRQWSHLRKEAQNRFVQVERPRIFAFDRAPKACQVLSRCLETFGLSRSVRVECRDFLSSESTAPFPAPPGVIVINPPYGRRLGTTRQSAELINAVGNRLASSFSGWRFAILVPDPDSACKLPFSYESRLFHHGGLKLVLLTGVI